MPRFEVEYNLTERTRRRVEVEADDSEEAVRLVEEYEADLSDSWQVDSFEYSVDEVEADEDGVEDDSGDEDGQSVETGAEDDLVSRCREILAWQKTGILSGNLLRDYADRNWGDEHDALRQAENATLREAARRLVEQAEADKA